MAYFCFQYTPRPLKCDTVADYARLKFHHIIISKNTFFETASLVAFNWPVLFSPILVGSHIGEFARDDAYKHNRAVIKTTKNMLNQMIQN